MEKQEKIFAEGMRVSKPLSTQPAFIKARLNIKVLDFIQFLQNHEKTNGYVDIDIKESKNGETFYAELNTWKPKPYEKPVDNGRTSPSEDFPEGLDPNNIPF